MDNFLLADALSRDIQGKATEEDRQLIELWLNQDRVANLKIYTDLKEGNLQQVAFEKLRQFNTEAALKRLHHKMESAGGNHQRAKPGIKWAAAAAVLALVVGSFSYYYFNGHGPESKKMMDQQISLQIGPAQRRAILKLPKGQQLEITESTDSNFAVGNVQLSVKQDSMKYVPVGGALETALMSLYTPLGATYSLTLADGTAVWLNAGSSITYPASFDERERRVEVTGEVFFQVKADPSHPFVVTAGETQVKALGTDFNVRAYHGTPMVATLIKGAVVVSSGAISKSLHPGQQAVNTNGAIQVSTADVQAVSAWKKGDFIFRNQPVEEVLEELARWYNVRIVYEPGFSKGKNPYNGEISRSVVLSKLLGMLEFTRVAHFTVDQQTVFVGEPE